MKKLYRIRFVDIDWDTVDIACDFMELSNGGVSMGFFKKEGNHINAKHTLLSRVYLKHVVMYSVEKLHD